MPAWPYLVGYRPARDEPGVLRVLDDVQPSARWASRTFVAASNASGSGPPDPQILECDRLRHGCQAGIVGEQRRKLHGVAAFWSLGGGFLHGRAWRLTWAPTPILFKWQSRIN